MAACRKHASESLRERILPTAWRDSGAWRRAFSDIPLVRPAGRSRRYAWSAGKIGPAPAPGFSGAHLCEGDFFWAAHHFVSITRDIGECLRFLNSIQCFDRPAQYGRSWRFDTKPSRPTSGPISPSSKGATKMPSGRRASRRAGLALRPCVVDIAWSSPFRSAHLKVVLCYNCARLRQRGCSAAQAWRRP